MIASFAALGLGAEPASSVNTLCKCCSEGSHEQQRSVNAGTQQVSLAAPMDRIQDLLDAWSRGGADRRWQDLTLIG